jgi:hypothetical protein
VRFVTLQGDVSGEIFNRNIFRNYKNSYCIAKLKKKGMVRVTISLYNASRLIYFFNYVHYDCNIVFTLITRCSFSFVKHNSQITRY